MKALKLDMGAEEAQKLQVCMLAIRSGVVCVALAVFVIKCACAGGSPQAHSIANPAVY